MILLIDNYDSFTYNLVQMMGTLGAEIHVVRNDAITAADAVALKPDAVVISPGPCSPGEAGISVEVIRLFSGKTPVLGVCLGHQSIAVAFGATVAGAAKIMHGKISQVRFDASPLYTGMKNPFPAGRYHSLAVQKMSLPDALIPDAFSEEGEIMGMHHRTHPTYGVQFHPESVLTPGGKRILRNFLDLSAAFSRRTIHTGEIAS